MNIIDLKLIDAYTILCLSKDNGEKIIEEIIIEVNVPEKYKDEVSFRIADKRIEVLSQ